MKVVLVTNIPTPYRVPVFNYIDSLGEIEFSVIYCAKRESNRNWNYGYIKHKHIYLKENFSSDGDNYIHKNQDVFSRLIELDPDVVITTGFNPTHLYAFSFALLKGKKHIPMTDGTVASEAFLTWKHRLVRRFVYSLSHAFIGASEGSRALYRIYGKNNAFYKSHLAINNDLFNQYKSHVKKFDLLFSGRFVEGKCPLFAINVIKKVKVILNRDVTVLFLGSGPLEGRMRELLEDYPSSAYCFHGFASQEDLPFLYASARILLFPTLNDTWGVVANEACSAGLPVITTPAAGVAGELIRDGFNGYVCDLNEEVWVERLCGLLTNTDVYEEFRSNSIKMVAEYNYENAARGILDAVRHVVRKK